MELCVRTFAQLSKQELYSLLKLRSEIFVFEQESICIDIDGRDLDALHVLLLDQSACIQGTTRLAPHPSDSIEIGRVCVAPPLRGQPYRDQTWGRRLFEFALSICAERFPGQDLILSAQASLETYYRQFGFEAQGDIFYFPKDHIPHIKMRSGAQ